jgi:polyphosphate glucokinase
VGGTGIKGSVLDPTGQMEHARVRVPTPYPLSPEKLVQEVQKLASDLPPFDRVSVGFPGMVRGGRVITAPHFVSPDGPGGRPEPKLVKAWEGFDLANAIHEVTGKPTKVANDADVQGSAVVKGEGLEMVMTLGTGVGTALFLDGQLMPHLELAHHPLSKGGTYNEVLGDAARRVAGKKKWNKRVLGAIESLRSLVRFDHLYIGGGNSTRLTGDLPADVTLIDNQAGILGGIKLWDATVAPAEAAARGLAPSSSAPRSPAARRPSATKAGTTGATTTRATTARSPGTRAGSSRAAAATRTATASRTR